MKQLTEQMKENRELAKVNARIRQRLIKPEVKPCDKSRRILYLPEEFTGSDLKNFYKLEKK